VSAVPDVGEQAHLVDCSVNRLPDYDRKLRHVAASESIVVTNLHHRLGEPKRNQEVLELVEHLVLRGPNPVTLCSEIDILRFLRQVTRDDETVPKAERQWPRDIMLRWGRVLARLEKHVEGDAPNENDFDRAAFYVDWYSTGHDGRVALLNVATDGLVSPSSWPTVVQLHAQGLIEVGRGADAAGLRHGPARLSLGAPGGQPAATFRDFVLNVEPRERVERWRREGGPSTWDHSRTFLTSMFLVVGGILVVLQPGGVTGWLSLFGAISSTADRLGQLVGSGRRVTKEP
jgi:hypothetical protein